MGMMWLIRKMQYKQRKCSIDREKVTHMLTDCVKDSNLRSPYRHQEKDEYFW